MTFRFHRRQNTPIGRMGHALCGSVVGPTHGLVLVPLPMPYIYLTLNGTYAGENVLTTISIAPQNSPTFVTGSLPGKQAVHLDGPSSQFLLFNAGDWASNTNPDYTMFGHVLMTDDYTFLYSSVTDDTNTQIEGYLQDNTAPGALYSNMYRSPTDCSGQLMGGPYTHTPTAWVDIGYVYQRSANVTGYYNGLATGTVVDISPLAAVNIPATTKSIAVGSRFSSASTIHKTATFAEWVLWRQTLTAPQMMTLHNLRFLGIQIKTWIGV